MQKPSSAHVSNDSMTILSHLLLSPQETEAQLASKTAMVRNISEADFDSLVSLAHSNHVIVRGLEIFRGIMLNVQDAARAEWAAAAVAAERARIVKAIEWLHVICNAFDEEGLDVTVMKSLDHWPDLGSDLDLYTNSSPQSVCAMMQRRFGAEIASRSWGDRLACKWNFNLPGLLEPVEVHMGRLGQTGEQLVLASRLPGRARKVEMEGHTFRVPSASDRLMISTLQRMYRHFYFRLCDIVDSATLAVSGALDYEELRTSAKAAGIWEGVATYLLIVSDYVRQYSGSDLGLPKFVTDTARFGGDLVYFGKDFLRVPIMPQSAALYRSQLAGLIRRGELQSSARLGLLPWLATAAAVGYKITGTDKGIW
ncbi:MAG: nucleotidyltransferase family protein [Acidobacteria bacterium]|uniref:Putative nucleotidyltransferase-like protein n=2 Tax=Acidipila rosea TaxID=768535 RepID=A0A4R1L3V0_9BACT|nr:nucleotidyltransferase family protein [Acidobacteriota bacterium]MBW4044564.1 nucleotidyltransferase family protein [Acidobacteriota bacterium]TCK72736.1 putative nucleotidyltransferase-like protein [Acidipila rosea]